MSTRGGERQGAGRKTGSSAFKELTVVKRIPQSLVNTVDNWLNEYKQLLLRPIPVDALLIASGAPLLQIPVAADAVRAGFPSPAAPYIADYLDFNQFLVSNPSATIAIYAKGESMIDAGISSGDMLVVNRSLEARHKDIVVAEVDNEFTVKRLMITSLGIELHAENSTGEYPNIVPTADTVISLVGVVEHIIKSLR